jgi:hypothetical protein
VEATFGGVRLNLSNNTSKAALTVMLLVDTANNGNLELLHTFYTMADRTTFVRRGLDAKKQNFGVVIRDKWNNKSDTVSGIVTPYEEVRLPDEGIWTNAKLPTDTWEPIEGAYSVYPLENLWIGPETSSEGNVQIWACPGSSPIPQHFTISFGYKASISRMHVWPRRNSELYTGAFPREIELWGSDNPPGDGSWDNWHLLGKWEVHKPSGYGDGRNVGTITAEDADYFHFNQEYELEVTDEITDPYRVVSFIRFKTVSTFNSYGTEVKQGTIIIQEIALWGTLQND